MQHLLWTDCIFLGFLLIGFLSILWSLKKAPNRQKLQYLFSQPLAIISGVVIAFFLIIGILDSIHIQGKESEINVNDVSSILDRILSPLDQIYEKTYSAPFALNLYSMEVSMVAGTMQQVFPRLTYPPESIQTNAQKWQIINQGFLHALTISTLTVLLCWLLYGFYYKRWKPSFNMSLALVSLLVCLFVIFFSYFLSRYFHILGTGKIGQDIFYYTVKSIRTGLIIGLLTTLFMLPLALILGISAGYFGGFIDDMIQFIYTTLSSVPGVLLITASVLSMQTYIANHPEQFSTLAKSADARLLALCFILGITSWTSLCRLLRAEALKFREMDFVLAARTMGSSSWYILSKHLLPNVMPIIIITIVLDFSFLVLAEAVLSYVGVGVAPTTISWGNMINSARLELARDPIVWWPMLAAFVLMFILVLASNLFADAIRDAFDPHHQ